MSDPGYPGARGLEIGPTTETYVRELHQQLRDLRARVAELESDKARLDYLDQINTEMNGRMGSNYGWGLDSNHLRIALEDHHFPALTVREAIDAARNR